MAMIAAACTGAGSGADTGDEAAKTDESGRSGELGDDGDSSSAGSPAGDEGAEQATEWQPVELAARAGPFQLTIDQRPDGLPGDPLIEAYDADGAVVGSARFAENGTAVLRSLPAGPVEIRIAADDGTEPPAIGLRTEPIDIPGEQTVDPARYRQTDLQPGFNYIPTRDGTTLSAFVSLPGSVGGGPYPVLVEYSGYSPSDPTATEDPYRLLIPALGYALVQVNVRGTGCSGGSFDAFERIQSLDGYDVIETVAAQPWAEAVGMFGVSYPGIMQLHVASTRPPSLAAIAPLSVTDGVDSVLYPGGIYNDGFGQEWTSRVGERAQALGQRWTTGVIAGGDEICEENQRLRTHNPDLVAVVRENPYLTDLAVERSARTYAGDIEVPTFIGGAWQDEQTGGRFPAIIERLDGVPVLRAVLYNGLHIDAVSGEMLVRLIEFFDLYVAERAPKVEPITRLLIGVGLSALFGESLTVPPSRYEGLTLEQARADYEAGPPIEVLFEQGAGDPNLPVPAFVGRFEQWPPADTVATSLYLTGSADAPTLDAALPDGDVTLTFETDPDEGQLTTIGDLTAIWTNRPSWRWPAAAADNSAVATTVALDRDLVLVGNLSADLWVSATTPNGGPVGDADIEVTISEIAPDGSETFVQAGWLRLSQRAQGPESTELRPVISGLEEDLAPLIGDDPVLARVEVLPFAHVFRAGSRLRLTIDTPGASRPQWRFEVDEDPVSISIHSSADQPSRLVLPVIPDFEVPTERPACGSLRGQPCRAG